MNGTCDTVAPPMLTARLIARSHLGRTIRVDDGAARFTVQYWPWGFGTESVLVDGLCAAKRRGWQRTMSGGYRFRLGDYNASLIVVVPWWCELVPLRDPNYV